MELSNERQIILELKAKLSDIGEVRANNMELIDQLERAKVAIEKLTTIREKQKLQIEVITFSLNIFGDHFSFRDMLSKNSKKLSIRAHTRIVRF